MKSSRKGVLVRSILSKKYSRATSDEEFNER